MVSISNRRSCCHASVHQDKSLLTTNVPLPNTWHCADTVIELTLLSHSRNPAGAMAPPLLKWQKSTFLHKLSVSDHTLSTQALPLYKSSGDQECSTTQGQCRSESSAIPKGYFCGSEKVHGGNRKQEDSLFNFICNIYLMVKKAWKLAIEGQNSQWALAGPGVGMPSVCQLPGGPSLTIDLQTPEGVSLGYCVMLLYQISDIEFTQKYT